MRSEELSVGLACKIKYLDGIDANIYRTTIRAGSGSIGDLDQKTPLLFFAVASEYPLVVGYSANIIFHLSDDTFANYAGPADLKRVFDQMMTAYISKKHCLKNNWKCLTLQTMAHQNYTTKLY